MRPDYLRMLWCAVCFLGALASQAYPTYGAGFSAWSGGSFHGGTLHLAYRVPEQLYGNLDWGYRWATSERCYGIVRGEAGLPLFHWPSGMLGVGTSLTWYWAKDSASWDWIEEFGDRAAPRTRALAWKDDDEQEDDDNPLGDLFLLTLVGVLYATGDALLSPVTSLNEEGHGIKFRPAITLEQRLFESVSLCVSHDFAVGSDDLFDGTTASITFGFGRKAAPVKE